MRAGESSQQTFTLERTGDANRPLTLSNAAASPVAVELEIADDDAARLTSPSRRLTRRDGLWLWKTTVPANGAVTLDYRLRVREP